MDNQEYFTYMDSREEGSEQSDHPMAELLASEFARVIPQHGETMEGTIVGINPSEIVVDIGCKSEGIVPARDLERMDPEMVSELSVGDTVYVYVVRSQDASGNSILSLSRALLETDWQKASEMFEAEEVFPGTVTSCNRGGVIVRVGRVRGFVPASQIASIRLGRTDSEEERIERLGELVGNEYMFKIIELDRRRNRLILSERAAMREWRQDQKEKLLEDLQEGETRKGVVSSLCDFGAFVDLGGADGLVHLSELSWSRVGHPREVLKVGQDVEVYVLSVDRDRKRIALSIKRLKAEPWTTVESKYEIGQLVKATVTKITDFGAFARLDEEIEGLIHISELSEDRVGHPSEVVHEGQELDLRIIRIDAARQRMGLSLRRVNEDQYFEDYDWAAEGDANADEGDNSTNY
ncbi:MAG: S1 RNA-binding domain-containing protein [Chloroflexi bacterium]|nr:S1 RNA-binding domain-containing protein [Chloroflexota bacterium]